MEDEIYELLHKKHQYQLVLLSLLLKKRCTLRAKRKHRFWVHDIIKGREKQGAYNNLVRELELDSQKFHEHFRMSPAKLEYILSLVGPELEKKSTVRKPLPAKMKLTICIRYVSLQFVSFSLPHNQAIKLSENSLSLSL